MNKNKPTTTSKLGNVEIAAWENEHEGKTFFNSSIGVRYRDKEGNYKDGSSFSEQDLACLIACAQDVLGELQARRRQ